MTKKKATLDPFNLLVAWIASHEDSGLMQSRYEYEDGMHDTSVIRTYDLETIIAEIQASPINVAERGIREGWWKK